MASPTPSPSLPTRGSASRRMQPYAYCVGNGLFEECDETETIPTNELFARDLVRRCKALAGVSE